MPCHIAADTKCNVCEESPADTLYMEQPMCYPCRVNSARESWAVDNARDAAAENVECECNADKACTACADGLYDYPEDNMTDAEADADTLASAGWGTDEDYGYFGDD